MAHTFNPSTWEAEAGGFLSSRPAWSTKWDPGQPGLHRETLSQKRKKKKKKKKNAIEITVWGLKRWLSFLRTLAALEKDPGSVPNTYSAAHNCL
jgi:hypothetical protein